MTVRSSRTSKNVTLYNGPIIVRSSRTSKNVTAINGSITVRSLGTSKFVTAINGSITVRSSGTLKNVIVINGSMTVWAIWSDLIGWCELVVRTVRSDSFVQTCCPNGSIWFARANLLSEGVDLICLCELVVQTTCFVVPDICLWATRLSSYSARCIQ